MAGRFVEAHYPDVAIKLPRSFVPRLRGFCITEDDRILIALEGEAEPLDITDRALALIDDVRSERPLMIGEPVELI